MIPEVIADDLTYFVPTFSPAFMLRGAQQYHEVVVGDIKRALRVAREGYTFKGRPYYILPQGRGNITVNEAVNYIDQCYRQGRAVAIDTENYGVGKRDALDQYSCKLHALGVSFAGTDDAVSFLTDNSLGRADTTRLMNVCTTVFRDPNIAKMFFNMGYDLEVLRRHNLECLGPMYDNLVYHHVSDPELDHDLGFVSQQFLDMAPWKVDYRSVERAGQGTLEQLLIYNALDTLATQWLTPILAARVEEIQQTHIAQMEVALMELAGRMGRYGIPIHEGRRVEIAGKLQSKRDAALQYIRQQLSWPEFNPRSSGDRQKLLYDRLGYPVQFYTEKTAIPQTGIKALIPYLDHPVVRALVKFDEYAKQLSTFVIKLPDLVDEQNRLHVHWNPRAPLVPVGPASSPTFRTGRSGCARSCRLRLDVSLSGQTFRRSNTASLPRVQGARNSSTRSTTQSGTSIQKFVRKCSEVRSRNSTSSHDSAKTCATSPSALCTPGTTVRRPRPFATT